MFRKLHMHMTLFCTMVTSCIILVMVFICLLYADSNLRSNYYNSFLTQLNSILIQLQEQDCISHQWLSKLQENGHFQLFLYDNGTPVSYQSYHNSRETKKLAEETANNALYKHNIDIFSTEPCQIITHTEYNFTSSQKQDFYVSAGIIPKKNGRLSFLILFTTYHMQSQIVNMRLVICFAGIAAILLLFIFSWHFTKRMIIPLEKSQKEQTLFIAAASHELRSPLTVLRSGIEVLRQTDDPGEQSHFLDLMYEESTHMQNLTNNLLLLANADSKHMPLDMQNCQPDGLLINIYEKYESIAAKKQIALSISLPEELLPDCYCSREKITQVFSILMDNALSYTHPGGEISISVQLVKPYLVFSFSDTGYGVPDEEKELVFKRFYRSGHSHSRTDKEHFGLGLCIAKEIVNAHKGKIWVEDNTCKGSCFYVKLPVSPHVSV